MEAKPFNSLTFYLVCEEIAEVALNGWQLPAPTLQLTPAAARVCVVAQGGSCSLRLTAGSVRVKGVKTILVSETAI
ncbi:hypothetical protein AN219_04550 [Streptomyces nanshensis]|nr:hypothetical protein AN219_04550 [Streptomyces nanshensis]